MLQVVQAGQFTSPDITEFKLHDERDADGDGDGENETRFRQYLNSSGDSFYNVCHLEGAFQAWLQGRYPVEKGGINKAGW